MTDSVGEVIFSVRDKLLSVSSPWRFFIISSNLGLRVSSSSRRKFKSVTLFSSSADYSPKMRCMVLSTVIWPTNGAGASTEPVLDLSREALREPAGRLLFIGRVFLNPGFGMSVIILSILSQFRPS